MGWKPAGLKSRPPWCGSGGTKVPPSTHLRLDRFVDSAIERFFRLGEILHLAIELQILVARLLHRWRRWRFVRRNLHVPIPPEPRPGRNQPAHRHVLLETTQVIDLAGDGC